MLGEDEKPLPNIFIEIIKRVLDRGKSGIILLPEIALTPQIAGRFKSVFGDKTALWHSQLTQSQRSSTWKKLYNGKYKIVIGARSAIFAPLKNLGLIIVDEEHDTSYKQDSPSPRYHARDVAIMRAKLERSSVLLSSATPSLESYYNYQCNKYEYLSLPKALGLAGDLTIYGKRKNVLVVRESGDGKKEHAYLDLTDASIVNSPFYYLQQNDVVYVEPNGPQLQSASYNRNASVYISIASVLVSLAVLLTR